MRLADIRDQVHLAAQDRTMKSDDPMQYLLCASGMPPNTTYTQFLRQTGIHHEVVRVYCLVQRLGQKALAKPEWERKLDPEIMHAKALAEAVKAEDHWHRCGRSPDYRAGTPTAKELGFE